MCTISVIVPVYNVEKTIEKCLKSILIQTFTDIEIIVVNDGTRDNSMEIVNKYREDDRIKVITKDNGGLPQARRTGFMAATGKYIFFIDSDDWIEKNTLKLLYETSQMYDADVVCCNISLDYVNSNHSSFLLAEQNGELSCIDAISAIHNMNAVYQYAWNKLFRKDIIKEEDFPNGHFIGEDYCTIIPIIERANKIVQIKEILYHYVQNGNSMSKAGFGNTYAEAYYQCQRIKKYLFKRYPMQKTEITCYHLLEEMAILNSMFRNNKYDEEIKVECIKDIKTNCRLYVCNNRTKLIYKISAIVISVNWKLYRYTYQVLHHKY